MWRVVAGLLTSIMIMTPPASAADKQKDEETLQKANVVLQDMLNSNDISQAALSKADCVLILPGVKKFGFGIGGSGGRGPLLCRSGQNFVGKWSAPPCIRSVASALVCNWVGHPVTLSSYS